MSNIARLHLYCRIVTNFYILHIFNYFPDFSTMNIYYLEIRKKKKKTFVLLLINTEFQNPGAKAVKRLFSS